MSHNHMAHMMNVSSEHTAHDTHASYQAMDHSNMHHSSMDHVSENHGSMETNVNLHGLHGMSMTFHGGYSENVLFESWKISSISGLIGSMIGIMIMAALYEGLKYYREYLFWKMYNSLQYRSVTMPQEKNVVAEDNRVVQ
ncbi:High affinity copper uptake protein 1 [Eufriesea mexicana]|uniref:Copper transport protein n=1 Tax=Eufriesea mexicana TaxID=516756 RepID=A0A310SGT8_9HYME|nr:High affinity copper uptake protein 1 [Eufriesea mexicana]